LTTAVHSPLKVEDVRRPGSRISRSRAWDALRLKGSRQIGAVELKIPVQGHYFGSSDLDLRAETAPLSSPAFFALGDSLAPFLLPAGAWRIIVDRRLYSAPELCLKRALESATGWRWRYVS
jgi:hypothetical protein